MNNNISILIGIFAVLAFASGCSLIAPEDHIHIEFDDNSSNRTATAINLSINSSITNVSDGALNKLYNSYLNGSINYTNSSNGFNVSYPGGRARIYIGSGGSSGGSSGSSSSSSSNHQQFNETYNQTESIFPENQSISDSSGTNGTNSTQNNPINETESNGETNDQDNNQTNATEGLNSTYNENETQSDDNYNNSQENEELTDENENSGNEDDNGGDLEEDGDGNGDYFQEFSEEENNEEPQEIPEFTTITAALVLIVAGYYIHRKISGKI